MNRLFKNTYVDSESENRIKNGYIVSLGSNVKNATINISNGISVFTNNFKNVSSSNIESTESFDVNTTFQYSNAVIYFETEYSLEKIEATLQEIMVSHTDTKSGRISNGESHLQDIELYYEILINVSESSESISRDFIASRKVFFLEKVLKNLMFKLGFKEDLYFNCWRK